MTSNQHAQSPAEDRPQRLTPEERSLRDMWLAEMWPVCHEVDHKAPKPRRTAA